MSLKIIAVSLLTGQVISHLLVNSYFRTHRAKLIEQKMLELAENSKIKSVSYDYEKDTFRIEIKENKADVPAFLEEINMVEA